MSASETSGGTYRPTHYNNPEDGDFKCKIHLVFGKLGKVLIRQQFAHPPQPSDLS